MTNAQRRREAKQTARIAREDLFDQVIARIESRGPRPLEHRVREVTGAMKRRRRVGR